MTLTLLDRFRAILGARRAAAASLLGGALFWTQSAAAAKIACVGDSITYGYTLSDPSTQSYPAVLQGLLGADHTVENFGVSGTTLLKNGDMPYWNETRYTDSTSFGPDIVIIMLGTNDAKPQNWSMKAEFAGDYQQLIDHYRSLGAVVYVAAPPRVYKPGAFGIDPTVVADEVVPLVEQIASTAGAPLIDVFSATNDHGELFPDTVHPNAQGAQLIAQTVADALTQYNFDNPPSAGSGGATAGTGGSPSDGAGGTLGAGGTTASSGGAASSAGGAPIDGTQSGGTANTASGGDSAGLPASGGQSMDGSVTGSGGNTSSDQAGPSRSQPGGGCHIARLPVLPGRSAVLGMFVLWGLRRRRR